MSVTITFEKKHFLMVGIIIALPFMIMAINSIFASATSMPLVGHPISELFVDADLDMGGYAIINSGNITIPNSGDGIMFSDGNLMTSAEDSAGIPGSAIWISKTFEWWDCGPYVFTVGSYTVGSKGGYIGTVEGVGGYHYCTKYLYYYVNGVEIENTGFRINQPLNPGDVFSVKGCHDAACTTGVTGSCSCTSKAWVKIGLWDY